MKLDTKAHSVFLLHYHLVLVIKYRRKVIDNSLSARAKEIFEHIAKMRKILLMESRPRPNIHILFCVYPKSNLSKFISTYKSTSSRLIKKEFESVRQSLWREYFWSSSFCLITTGGAPLTILRKHIERQGKQNNE